MSFSIGLIADLQYGDIDDFEEHKFYRAALHHARLAVEEFAKATPSFLVNLGDIIEGDCSEAQAIDDLNKTLAILTDVGPWHHVVGNHCLKSLPRATLHPKLGLSDVAYYTFTLLNYTFIVLDSQDISITGTVERSAERAEAERLLAALKGPNILDWNGAVSKRQLEWFDAELKTASDCGRKVIVFNHIPFARAATSDRHLLWNCDEVLAVLDRYQHVQACFYGHYHKSGYCVRNGVHHVTLHGALEAQPDAPCHAILHVHEDRLELIGFGFDSRTMLFKSSRD
jgi:manganese-dependent ADP-ribose/CDP-alcohol diphosphatase